MTVSSGFSSPGALAVSVKPSRAGKVARFGYRSVRAVAAATLLAGLLAGCGTSKGVPQPCPEVIMPSQTKYLTAFEGGQDLSDISYEAKIETSPALCWYSNSGVEPATIRTSFHVQVQVTRGPKFKGDKVTLKYAIGITGPGGEPITDGKKVFDLDVDMSKGQISNIADDTIERLIIFPKPHETGDFYRILVGLDLTKDELDYNKRNPRR
jgi:hypothetical protein